MVLHQNWTRTGFRNEENVRQCQILQGSHSHWKTWKNEISFSSQGKVREFSISQGKVREFSISQGEVKEN